MGNIEQLAKSLDIDLDNEKDRCWFAGYLQGIASENGYDISDNMTIGCASFCLTLDVPEHQKAWARVIINLKENE